MDRPFKITGNNKTKQNQQQPEDKQTNKNRTQQQQNTGSKIVLIASVLKQELNGYW